MESTPGPDTPLRPPAKPAVGRKGPGARRDAAPAPPVDAAAPLSSPGNRLRAIVLAEMEAAGADLARPAADLHAGVHQARKHLRRARAALALGGGRLGSGLERLDDDIGRFVRGLSSLRDAQALLEGLDRLLPSAPPALVEAAPRVIALARQRRDAVLVRALARDPDFARRRRRLQGMGVRAARLDWTALDDASLAKRLARSIRRVEKARRGIARHPQDDERWHRLRRRLRRLRQQDHLLELVLPALRVDTAAAPVAETARLGEAQDDALVLRHCGHRSPFPPALRRLLREEAKRRLRVVRAGG